MYGIENEKKARDSYYLKIKDQHHNLKVYEVGFAISMSKPIMGASPDGFVQCDCCTAATAGCIEVKCPHSMKDSSIEEYAKSKNSCLIASGNNYSLDREHAYYYQTQLQMFCSETKFCDFVLWSKKCLFIERIFINNDFLNEKLKLAENFHAMVIVPELLSRCFTQPIIKPALELNII